MEKILFKTKMSCLGAIIDNEISNDISPNWDYCKGLPCVVGVWKGNQITQISLRKGDEQEFKKEIIKLLDSLQDVRAFNKKMEEGNFLGYLNKKYYFGEIKQFNGKGSAKEDLFKLMLEHNAIPKKELSLVDLDDPLNGDHKNIMGYYAQNKFEEIEKANRVCLIKEFFIEKYSEWLFDHLELDEGNWIIQHC